MSSGVVFRAFLFIYFVFPLARPDKGGKKFSPTNLASLPENGKLTENFNGVGLIPVDLITDLAHIVARILRLQLGDLQVVSAHKSYSLVGRHFKSGGRQNVCTSSP